MGSFSLIHWLILGVVILLLFGRGRFSDMMGDVANGLKSFRKGLSDDETSPAPPEDPPKQITKQVTKEIEEQLSPRASDADTTSPVVSENRNHSHD